MLALLLLRDYLTSDVRNCVTYSWSRHTLEGEESAEEAARLVALRIMAYRCRNRPDRFEAWLQRFWGGAAPTGLIKRSLEIIIQTAVGLEAEPRSQAHVEAFVAEHVWFFLAEDFQTQDSLIAIEGPSVDVTEPGADGLVIHRLPNGSLMFRLWEIKKHSGSSHTSATARIAYSQIDAKAERYLNKVSLTGQYKSSTPEVERFYALLMDLWMAADPSASAGVAIVTSGRSVPTRAFTRFPDRFPRFVTPQRLRGLVAGLADFPNFATRVQSAIWRGL